MAKQKRRNPFVNQVFVVRVSSFIFEIRTLAPRFREPLLFKFPIPDVTPFLTVNIHANYLKSITIFFGAKPRDSIFIL